MLTPCTTGSCCKRATGLWSGPSKEQPAGPTTRGSQECEGTERRHCTQRSQYSSLKQHARVVCMCTGWVHSGIASAAA
jgi:hypothetical protein